MIEETRLLKFYFTFSTIFVWSRIVNTKCTQFNSWKKKIHTYNEYFIMERKNTHLHKTTACLQLHSTFSALQELAMT